MKSTTIKINKVESVELKITDTNVRKYVFPDNDRLRGKFIVGVETHLFPNVTTTPQGNPLIVPATLAFAYLTLAIKGSEDLSKLPLNSLLAANYNGGVREMDYLQVDFTKSYIEFAGANAIGLGQAALFNFYYVDKLPGTEKQYREFMAWKQSQGK